MPYDVTADGQRLLLDESVARNRQPLTMLTGWRQSLGAAAATNAR